jgi:tRNA uridine 5-carbamoylmethylation protein Kti12
MTNTLIAMVGLPRSGKSTISRDLSKKLGAPIVSRDCLRLAVHGQRYASAAEPLIKTLDVYMIRALFLAGHNLVIVDETNFSEAAREHLKDPSWDTLFYPVMTDVEICLERAKLTNQEDLIPIINQMNARWEPIDLDEWVFEYEEAQAKRLYFSNYLLWREISY